MYAPPKTYMEVGRTQRSAEVPGYNILRRDKKVLIVGDFKNV